MHQVLWGKKGLVTWLFKLGEKRSVGFNHAVVTTPNFLLSGSAWDGVLTVSILRWR